MGDKNYVIGGDAAVVPMSVRYHCAECRAPTWLAVSGQQQAMRGYVVLCLDCGLRKASADGEEIRLPSPTDILRDLRGG